MPPTQGLHQPCMVSEFANAAKSVMGGWFREKYDSLVSQTTIFLFYNTYDSYTNKFSVYSHSSSQIHKFDCCE